jgi:hypothetical protein
VVVVLVMVVVVVVVVLFVVFGHVGIVRRSSQIATRVIGSR